MTSSRSPRVTVTIPTYNRAHLLREAIRSVLSQSVTDLELFVSDNASTDDTAAAVASFDDARVHYVRNNKNLGHLVNMSRGFHLGTAPFVAILPDDDIMLPESLKRKVRFLEEYPRVGIAHSASKLFHVGTNGEVLQTNVYFTGGPSDAIEAGSTVLRRMLSDSYWIHFPSALIRRSLVGDACFDAADGLGDDLGMFLRLLRHVDSVAYVAEPLTAIRMHSGAHSSQNAFHEFRDGAFLPTFLAIANIRMARNRFLVQYGKEIQGIGEIRSCSRRWIRRMLMKVAQWKSAPCQSRLVSWQLLREAAAVDAGVIFTPDGIRFLAKTVLGARGEKLVRRIRRFLAV